MWVTFFIKSSKINIILSELYVLLSKKNKFFKNDLVMLIYELPSYVDPLKRADVKSQGFVGYIRSPFSSKKCKISTKKINLVNVIKVDFYFENLQSNTSNINSILKTLIENKKFKRNGIDVSLVLREDKLLERRFL